MKYIKEKAAVLADFGLTNKSKVEAYLHAKAMHLPDTESKIRCIDFAARQLISAFYNGSTEFIDCIGILRQKYPREIVLSANVIIKCIGEDAFNNLVEQGRLKYSYASYHRDYYKF